MSIIYDALKKAQVKITRPEGILPKPAHKKNTRPISSNFLAYFLVIAVGLSAGAILYSYFKLQRKITPPPIQIPAPPVQMPPQAKEEPPAPKVISPQPEKQETIPSFTLNGIFFSENDTYALVNNRIVREGDDIEGCLVKKINPTDVEIALRDKIIKLSTKNMP